MKKMVLNKKGQGLPTSTLVLMIIAVVVLVFVILGFTVGWGYIFDKMGLLPDDLTVAVQACVTYAGSDALKISFCEYRKLTLEGKKGYYNCEYVKVAAEEVSGTVEWSGSCVLTGEAYCTRLSGETGFKPSTIVNNQSCTDWGVTEAA